MLHHCKMQIELLLGIAATADIDSGEKAFICINLQVAKTRLHHLENLFRPHIPLEVGGATSASSIVPSPQSCAVFEDFDASEDDDDDDGDDDENWEINLDDAIDILC